MPQNLSREIAQCYQQASACKARAERTTDPQQRALLLDMERRWLLLAKSHEMRQRLTAFAEQAKDRLHVLTPALHPAIPRVMCPQCGKNMRLDRIEPVSARRADRVTYNCECGLELQQTLERVDWVLMPSAGGRFEEREIVRLERRERGRGVWGIAPAIMSRIRGTNWGGLASHENMAGGATDESDHDIACAGDDHDQTGLPGDNGPMEEGQNAEADDQDRSQASGSVECVPKTSNHGDAPSKARDWWVEGGRFISRGTAGNSASTKIRVLS